MIERTVQKGLCGMVEVQRLSPSHTLPHAPGAAPLSSGPPAMLAPLRGAGRALPGVPPSSGGLPGGLWARG